MAAHEPLDEAQGHHHVQPLLSGDIAVVDVATAIQSFAQSGVGIQVTLAFARFNYDRLWFSVGFPESNRLQP